MTDVVLIQAQPRFASSGALVDVRLAGGGSQAYMQLGFSDWRSGVVNLPRFTTEIDYNREGPTGGAVPQTAGFQFSPSDRSYFSALGNVIWEGARVIVTSGDDEATPPVYRQRLIGTVSSAKTSGASVTFTIADLSLDLDKPACPNTFAGTGGIEGGDEATGRVKRRTWGRVFNVEGRLLDKANSIYEFGDPAFALQSFDMVKDKGVGGPTTVVAWQGSVDATLTALRNAAAPTSGAAVAPSIACVKWFTTPAGPLTADITGSSYPGARDPASLADYIVTNAAPSIGVEDRSAAVAWVPYEAGIHSDTAGETFGNLLDRLLLPVFIAWVLDGAGVLRFRRLTWSGPVEQIAAVEPISREEVLPAIKGRKLGFQKNHRQQNDGEISTTLLLATDATYADGTPIEALKPLEKGANVTEQRTAAAISGQGSLATLSQLDRTGGYLTGFGDLAGQANVYFGSGYLLEQQGGAVATLAAFKTLLGQAASFTGQGALATLNALANGGPYLTGFGPLAGKDRVMLGNGGGMVDESNSYWLTTATVVTSQGSAASIAGQSYLATNYPARLYGSPQHGDGYLAASAMAFAEGNTVQGLRPGEANANVTENRNSAGFQGQGALATLSTLANGGPYLSGFAALSALSFVQFGASRTVVTSDGTTVTDAIAITSLGTASAIVGQGGLATKNQTNTSDIVAGAVSGGTAAGGSGSTTGQMTVVCDVTYTPQSSDSTLFVDMSVVYARSATSAASARAIVAAFLNNQQVFSRTLASQGSFAWPFFFVNRSGSQRIQVAVGFTSGSGSGDPHTIDEANIRILEVKR